MADETAVEETEEQTAAETEETVSEETTSAEPNWKQESRKHERRAKDADKRLKAAEAKLAAIEEEGATDQEKAVAKAREEAAAEAKAAAHAELRDDRLEVAVTRLANGIKVDDDSTVKFADPDDALVHVQRAIRNDEVDPDDIFDSGGKVQTDALKDALLDLLERKPHLKASDNGNTVARPTGGADGGRGAAGGDEESLTPAQRFDRLSGSSKHK